MKDAAFDEWTLLNSQLSEIALKKDDLSPCLSTQSAKKINVHFLVYFWELGILPRVPRETLLLCA